MWLAACGGGGSGPYFPASPPPLSRGTPASPSLSGGPGEPEAKPPLSPASGGPGDAVGVPPLPPASGEGDAATDTSAFADAVALGFYDVNAAGEARAVRNDLSGALQGMVQFVQSHSVQPAGNLAASMPTLVPRRAALLLFTPQEQAQSIRVTASVHGVVKGTFAMRHPNVLPRADSVGDSRPEVGYSKRAWSATLPWDWVVAGLTLNFEDEKHATGVLGSSAIEMGVPHAMVLTSIELGMLTDPPTGDDHALLTRPEKAAADYFQTVPLARLTVARYESVRLDKVIVASGQIYTAPQTSAMTGDVYTGDLRENVGKAQFSTGVNLASFGITSSPMDQVQPGIFNQRVIHHSAGAYTNGVVVHGLSGGNGMATLYSSSGNEFSHELGHSYGLGHYPGMDSSLPTTDAKLIRAVHHADSGWGYIAYRNRMRGNLIWNEPFSAAGTDVDGTRVFGQTFAGLYNYNRDAMSSGLLAGSLSDYTHHTGYSADLIQRSLRNVVPDAGFASGYRSWSAAAGAFVDAKAMDPTFSARAPAKVGVPVFTVLGGYNPDDGAQVLLYAPFRSNHGNVFALPAPDLGPGAGTQRQCWLEVKYLGGRVDHIDVLATSGVKQINVNIEEAAQPDQAKLLCSAGNGAPTQLGNAISFPKGLPAMPAPVVIGEEHGYEALRKVEIAQLEAELQEASKSPIQVLDADAALMLESWRDDLSGLSPAALALANRLLRLNEGAEEVSRFMNRYRQSLIDGDSGRRTELAALLQSHGFTEAAGAPSLVGAQVKVDADRCLALDTSAQPPVVHVLADPAACTDVDEQKWFVDVRGAIHNMARPDLCIGASTPVSAAACAKTNDGQVWLIEHDGHVQSFAHRGQYLDLYRSTMRPGLYGPGTGSNQIWTGWVQSTNPAIGMLSAANVALLFKLGLQ